MPGVSLSFTLTIDGFTVVDPDGKVVGSLPPQTFPLEQARRLLVQLDEFDGEVSPQLRTVKDQIRDALALADRILGKAS